MARIQIHAAPDEGARSIKGLRTQPTIAFELPDQSVTEFLLLCHHISRRKHTIVSVLHGIASSLTCRADPPKPA